jgi:fimbrial chaperone protein
MNKRLLAAAISTAALACQAAEFSVTPVRIFMTPRDRAVAVTISNEGTESVVIQADLFAWKQKPTGEDDLTPTDGIVLSPPIVTIAPKARQVLRLARVAPPAPGEEQTYRMILREVPEAKPSDGTVKVQVALAFSIPIFVTPPEAKRQLACTTRRTARDSVQAVCENAGRAYVQARAFSLIGADTQKLVGRDSGGYILPGIQRSFDLKSPTAIPPGKVTLQVGLDDGTTQAFEATLPE